MSFLPGTLAAVEAALSREWATSREVSGRVQGWAPRTIRSALAELAAAGRVEARKEPRPQGEITRFRAPDRSAA